MHLARTAALAVAVAALPACNEPRPVDLAGAWTGTMTDAAGTRTVGAQFTQSGLHVRGTGTVVSPQGGSGVNSVWVGTILDGPVFSFSLGVTAPPCTINVAGTADVGRPTFEATYHGTDSCAAQPFADGRMTLRRR
jgi:hypothetical protein